MVKLVPFKRWHMAWLQEQAGGDKGFAFDTSTLLTLEQQNSWTLVADMTPVACGGTMQLWPGRHTAWTYLNKNTGKHMVAITKAALDGLAKIKGRIELTVLHDFEQGHRWARILGFKVETPEMPMFGPNGETHTGYVRFNEGQGNG